MTATQTSTGSELHRNENGYGRFRGKLTSLVDPVHDAVQPSAGISSRRRVSFPEVSSDVWTRPPAQYMPGSNEVTTDMSYTHSSESGVPPSASRQRQRSQPHPSPLQTHPPTAPLIPPPQSSSPVPHQGAPGKVGPPLPDPSTQPASAAPVTQRGSIAGHQDTLSNVHPHLHGVRSPLLAFPRHMDSPIQEENMHYLAPSMMTTPRPHGPVYQDRTPPDLVPTPSHTFPPSASAPTSPIYPHALNNTSPPPNSPSTLRHSMSGPLSSAHHSTPYAMHGAYTPMGYTTPPSYAYPSPPSFVPVPSIYGSHSPPPHYSRPYGFPTGQESQGTWWYLPPGVTAAFNFFEGTQREYQPRSTAGYPPVGQLDGEPPVQRNTASLPSEPQPSLRQINRTRVSRPFNDMKQEATQALSPTLPTRARTDHQERRSYHPKPPAHRSEWVMWAGNVPSDATQDELRDFFNQPLTPLSLTQTEPPEDRQQVYGGVSTVFLILRSNCAFVNFESEAQLEAATARFNGQPVRPDDPRCPGLVCRVRRREDDLMSGVGAQRGSGMHIKWVKEQKARVLREQAGTVGSPKDTVRPSSPSSVSNDDGRGIEEGHASTHSNLSRSTSITSTDSDILRRYFPQRYFILKSLTQNDLDLSVQKHIWATQRHNEEILDQAYRTSKDVFLIFSVNKSGEFYGYARMAGPVLRDDTSATGSTAPPSSVSSLSEVSAGASPSADDDGTERQDPLYTFPTDEHQAAKPSPQSAPAGRPSFALSEPHEPHHRLTNSMPNSSTSPPHEVDPVQASSSKLTSDALSRSPKNPSTRGTRESVERDAVSGPILLEREVSDADIGDGPKPVSEVSRDDGTGSTWDRPFRVEWIRADSLPFFRTWHLRNPWNHGREVKVSRDGTELEPTVGRQLLGEWDRPSAAVDNLPGPSWTPEWRRGPKSHPQ